ncbi:hypothetical protein IPM19_03950 [bacterium]|nr:MAG: hypothetical protein IPM19_03950 [bacterium]
MNHLNNGSNPPQGNQPQHHDRKVRLLLALLVVLGGTLAFMATPMSERLLGVNLSSLFSSADVERPAPIPQPMCEIDGVTTHCDPPPSCDPAIDKQCTPVFNCIRYPCIDPNISIVNPEPNAKWVQGQTYSISWNSPPRLDSARRSVYSLVLEPSSPAACTNAIPPSCTPQVVIVKEEENSGSTKWTVPTNLPKEFFDGASNLILTIDGIYRAQTSVQIVKTNSDPGDDYPPGTYIRLLSNPNYVFKMGDGVKHPLPYPAEEVMACLGLNPALIRNGIPAHERIPEAEPIYCNPQFPAQIRDNQIVSGVPNTPFNSIYLVKDGQLRLIPNDQVLSCLGYDRARVRIATRQEASLRIGANATCIIIAGGDLTLTGDGTLPSGTVNVPYNAKVSATGGIQPYNFSIVGVTPPAKVSIDNSGQISATFVAAGTYKIKVGVTDSGQRLDAPHGAGVGEPFPEAKIKTSYAEKTYSVTINQTTQPPIAANCVDGPVNTLTALYRYYSARDTDHYYSTSATAPSGYASEGITTYIYPNQAAGTVPLYQSYNAERRDHYYTTDLAGAQTYGYKLDGTIGYVYPTQVTGSSPLYRMYNDSSKHYLATSSTVERDAILGLGFVQQGFVGYTCGTPRPGSEIIPVYRLWNSKTTDHFYTTRMDERDDALKRGYVSEGIAGNMLSVPGSDRIAVYRLWSAKFGDHFYTTSDAEAKASGYAREGIIGYIYNSPSSNRAQLYRLNNSKLGDHFYTTQAAERDAAVKGGYKFEGTMGYLP